MFLSWKWILNMVSLFMYFPLRNLFIFNINNNMNIFIWNRKKFLLCQQMVFIEERISYCCFHLFFENFKQFIIKQFFIYIIHIKIFKLYSNSKIINRSSKFFIEIAEHIIILSKYKNKNESNMIRIRIIFDFCLQF